MFTLSSLYDADQELLAEKRNGEDAFFNELVTIGVDYWTTVSSVMPDWQRVTNGIRPIELRQENISTHSVVLRALCGLGAEIMRQFPSDWNNLLADLNAVNWSKRNREWENVCMVAGSVVSEAYPRRKTIFAQHCQHPVGEGIRRGKSNSSLLGVAPNGKAMVNHPKKSGTGFGNLLGGAWRYRLGQRRLLETGNAAAHTARYCGASKRLREIAKPFAIGADRKAGSCSAEELNQHVCVNANPHPR